jgi:hypothetical protein
MKMYIARDEDGRLNLFDEKPKKFVPLYSSRCVWTVPRGYFNHIMLSPKLFPEVTFENSPKEVELKLIEK